MKEKSKKNFCILLYLSGMATVILYYIFCFLHIYKEIYIAPWFNNYINILIFILLVIIPIIYFIKDFWTSKKYILLKVFITFMTFMMLSAFTIILTFILFLFNPMTIKADKITYNRDNGLYTARWCSLGQECSSTEYIAKFIFLKEIGDFN